MCSMNLTFFIKKCVKFYKNVSSSAACLGRIQHQKQHALPIYTNSLSVWFCHPKKCHHQIKKMIYIILDITDL